VTKKANHYDVIIIGAGSIGTPTALFLAKNGHKVLVLESVPSVGQGSNKRAIGGIRATHSDPAKIRLSLRSIEIFSTWKETYGDEIEWEEGGYAFVAYRQREEKILKDLLVTQKSFGLDIDWYDQEAFLKIVPDLNPDGLIGGTFSPHDGSASPLLATHAFYIHAQQAGADFHFSEAVTSMVVSNGRVTQVITDKDTYSADIVINAAGPWAAEIGKLTGLDLPVRPDSHEAAITEAVAPFLKPMVVDIRPTEDSSTYYFYQHLTGQIIFCITPIMPRLANIRVRRTWRGLYPMTPDGFPIIGWAQEPSNLLLAVGMCGQGFMLGPGVGELLTRMVEQRLEPEDSEVLSIVSPNRKFIGQEALK